MIDQLFTRKNAQRLWLVGINSANSLLVPLFTVLVSLLVVRRVSAEIWGQFVSYLIVVQMGAHVIAWGNKQYLLREFSLEPARIQQFWQDCLLTRLLLFPIFVLVIAFFGWTGSRVALIALWTLATVWQQSHDVVVLYQRDFLFALVTEVTGIALLLSLIWINAPALTIDDLLLWHLLATALRGLVYAWRFRPILTQQWSGAINWRYFSLASAFFLLGFSGMLNSRIDLYSVNVFLSSNELAQYQLFIGFMLYLQSLAAFIIMPFIKRIYQLSHRRIMRIAFGLLTVGFLLVPPGLLLVQQVMVRIYGFELPWQFYAWGAVYVIPIYFSVPIIYSLYKENKQRLVLIANLFGSLGNLALNLLLIPVYGMLGALIATSCIRICTVTFYGMQGMALRRSEPQLEAA